MQLTKFDPCTGSNFQQLVTEPPNQKSSKSLLYEPLVIINFKHSAEILRIQTLTTELRIENENN